MSQNVQSSNNSAKKLLSIWSSHELTAECCKIYDKHIINPYIAYKVFNMKIAIVFKIICIFGKQFSR